MFLLNLASALIALAVLIAWLVRVGREGNERRTRAYHIRRFKVAWELRGLILVIAGPIAGGILSGYIPERYLVPLILNTITGFLAAEIIAPWSLGRMRR